MRPTELKSGKGSQKLSPVTEVCTDKKGTLAAVGAGAFVAAGWKLGLEWQIQKSHTDVADLRVFKLGFTFRTS